MELTERASGGPTALPAGAANAIAVGLGVLGDEWSLLILRAAYRGASRFGEFQDLLGISAASLTGRLSRLTDEQMLGRRIYQDKPIRAEYVLTDRGRAAWPILLAIWDWERTWVTGRDVALPTMIHRSCGRAFRPRVTCVECGEHVGPGVVKSKWGPAGGWARSVPETTTRRRSTGSDGRTQQFPETMAIFGNRWSAVVIGAAFQGVDRFSQFHSVLGVPTNLLAERLRVLVELGFLTHDGDAVDARPGYHLTEKGRAFFPVVILTLQWAQRWYRSPEGPALEWLHRDHATIARLDCDRCLQPLEAADVALGDEA